MGSSDVVVWGGGLFTTRAMEVVRGFIMRNNEMRGEIIWGGGCCGFDFDDLIPWALSHLFDAYIAGYDYLYFRAISNDSDCPLPSILQQFKTGSLGQQIGSLIELDLDVRGQWGSGTIMCYFGLWVVGFRGILIGSEGFDDIEKWE